MNMLMVLLVIAVVAVLLGLWWRRRLHAGRITANDAATAITPIKVELPDEDGEPVEPSPGRRPPETQELRRKLVHGPYRAIDDRGAPSEVQPGRQP